MLEVMPERCVTIAKKELLYLGPVGLACWVCGLIFIDRKKKKAAMDIMEHVAQIMRQEDVSEHWGNCTIRILPKIETQGLGLEKAIALAESTRKLMQNTFYEISEELCVEKEMRK
ncbi:hypothetical protein JD844_002055 [Phrynosoma platyrhinos]|uniref:1-acylglycerol-3-phosphate O-acyltransferase n=1 Tax=Phrynosoma platyrhinos TaxID=52577 RepID=A0ABQ7TB29_PHRPL|nr:hypothetical protein JD844_002055 [Phrynosoma platyrhinos]